MTCFWFKLETLCLIISFVTCKQLIGNQFSTTLQRRQNSVEEVSSSFLPLCSSQCNSNNLSSSSIVEINSIRGGKAKKAVAASKNTAKKGNTSKNSLIVTIKEQLNQIKPATRYYLLLSLLCTVIHLVGLPAPAILSLNAARFFEIWRPFTAVSYFGAPSLSAANSMYFLIRYGQQLETINGTGAHAWFLFIQTIILSTLGVMLGFPFLAQAMIAATVYVSCRMDPFEKMPFQFGLVVTSWQLPFCSMIIDCLAQQSASAAWPHLLGIFSGHVYHFFTTGWPALGGKSRLNPPKWWLKKLGGKPASNVAGIDFRKDSSSDDGSSGTGGSKASKLAKKAKQGKGRKLGS